MTAPINTFLGLNAREWAFIDPDDLPVNDMTGRRLTVGDLTAGIAAMLDRLDPQENQ